MHSGQLYLIIGSTPICCEILRKVDLIVSAKPPKRGLQDKFFKFTPDTNAHLHDIQP